jgi:hypothetical protein
MVSQDLGPRRDPASVDRAGLEEALRPFGDSRMLPRGAYVDPAVFEWEQRHFFGGGWMCVEVDGPGRQPIYSLLTQTPDANGEAGDIQWNFEKFLVRPDGTVTTRTSSNATIG